MSKNLIKEINKSDKWQFRIFFFIGLAIVIIGMWGNTVDIVFGAVVINFSLTFLLISVVQKILEKMEEKT